MTSTLAPRPASDSAAHDQAYMVFPDDLNANDTVFGGMIMAHMDRLAAVVADRHAAGTCVTVSVDAVHFLQPAKKGDVLLFNASVNRAWTSSMEIGVRVEAEHRGALAGTPRRHILSAYLTFVAVGTDGRPRPVPPLAVSGAAEQRRYDEAQLRRESRLAHAEALKTMRAANEPT